MNHRRGISHSDTQVVMEIRKATSVMQEFSNSWREYRVGDKSRVPGHAMETVLEIEVSFSPKLMAEVEFEDYGSILLTEFISEIRFEDSNYKDILIARKELKKQNQ